MNSTLTTDQEEAVLTAVNHIMIHKYLRESGLSSHKTQFMCLSGYAGTGKSVVISEIWKLLVKLVSDAGLKGCVTTLTGRACENLNEKGVPCNTAHSLFFEAVLDHNGNLLYFKKKGLQDLVDEVGDFVIVEEASMMPLDMLDNVIKTGAAILFVGDPAQLECIEGYSVFDVIESDSEDTEEFKRLFEAMPMFFLDKILRTEDGSSINTFAGEIRTTGRLNASVAGDDVSFLPKRDLNLRWLKDNWKDWDVIICGTNRTRKKYNRLIRAAKGFSSDLPEVGDRIVCLKNTVVGGNRMNNGELYIVHSVYEGDKISTFQVQKLNPSLIPFGTITSVSVDNNMWDEETRLQENFSRQDLHDFTFGYALTSHKMQGSSLPNVIFYDEDVSFFLDQQKFRYTACTRPTKRLMVVR